MVSYPGYDLNKLSGTVDAEYWNKLINDQSEPLYDKATQVRIAPGSVYKLVTTSAGLEEGVIDSSEYINCIGTCLLYTSPFMRMAAIYEVNPRIRMKAGLRERRSCVAIRGKHQKYKN